MAIVRVTIGEPGAPATIEVRSGNRWKLPRQQFLRAETIAGIGPTGSAVFRAEHCDGVWWIGDFVRYCDGEKSLVDGHRDARATEVARTLAR